MVSKSRRRSTRPCQWLPACFWLVKPRSSAQELLKLLATVTPVSQVKITGNTSSGRVGSYYFPQQVVTKQTEKFAHTQAAWASLRQLDWAPNQVDFDEFFGETSGSACLCTSLETAGIGVNLQGLPLNNSSTGEVRFTNGSSDVRGVLFLEFVTVCSTSLNRSVIKI